MKKIVFSGENFKLLFYDLFNSLFSSKPEGQDEENNIILPIFVEEDDPIFLLFGEVVDMRILGEKWLRWV